MKKFVHLLIIPFLSVFASGCWENVTGPESRWYVKNNTDQLLKITYSPHDFLGIGVKDITLGDSICIQGIFTAGGQRNLYFDELFELRIRPQYGGMVSFTVLSESGYLSKEWHYGDKELPGKQFFNESSWRLYRYKDGQYTSATWVFEIWPEDLIEKEEF